MKVSIKKGDQTLCASIASKDVITKPEPKNTNTTLKVKVVDFPANNHKYLEPNKPKFNAPKITAKVVGNEEEANNKPANKKIENQTNDAPPKTTKSTAKKASKPELISVEEDGDKVNIKFRVNAVKSEVEDTKAEDQAEVVVDKSEDNEEIRTEEEPSAETDVDDSDSDYNKYSEYDDDESSRNQRIRSKSTTKKPSEEGPNNRKKTPTRIPKR